MTASTKSVKTSTFLYKVSMYALAFREYSNKCENMVNILSPRTNTQSYHYISQLPSSIRPRKLSIIIIFLTSLFIKFPFFPLMQEYQMKTFGNGVTVWIRDNLKERNYNVLAESEGKEDSTDITVEKVGN